MRYRLFNNIINYPFGRSILGRFTFLYFLKQFQSIKSSGERKDMKSILIYLVI